MTDRRPNPWIAFAAGAVAMLALVLACFAWLGGDDAVAVAEAAAQAADAVPDLKAPSLPEAPRIPDVPIPVPK